MEEAFRIGNSSRRQLLRGGGGGSGEGTRSRLLDGEPVRVAAAVKAELLVAGASRENPRSSPHPPADAEKEFASEAGASWVAAGAPASFQSLLS